MFDPSTLTLGQVSSALRDLTVVGVLITASWKSRGLYDEGKNFLKRLMTHMDTMEAGMNTLLSNHLVHIESSLNSMAHSSTVVTKPASDVVEL